MLIGKIINNYYKKYWYFFVLGIICLVGVDIGNLFIPEKLGEVVGLMQKLEKDPGNPDIVATVSLISIQVVMVGFGMFVGRICWRLTIFNAATRIESDFRNDMFEKATKLSQSYYHSTKVGTILNWVTTDVESITDFLGWGTIMLVDAFFMSLIVLARMFFLNWSLSLILLGPILLIGVWGALSEKYMTSVWEDRQRAGDKIYDFAQESFSGIRVIKAFVKERQQEMEFERAARKSMEMNVRATRISSLFERFIDILLYAIFAFLLGFGGYLVYCQLSGSPLVLFGRESKLELPELVSLIAYFDTLIWPMIALGSVITMRSRASASLKRITNFMDEKEDVKTPENAIIMDEIEGAIEFKDFSFSHEEGKPTLQNISLTIKAGETIGVVGRIGCGKTTLVDCLLRLNNYQEGTLFIDGIDLMQADLASLRDRIAYVPQDNFLFSDTVGNNIRFGKNDATQEEIERATMLSEVAGDIQKFPNGYDTVLGERGTTVSGGQKQRISMARAYLKNAPILIMDDSVSAVDVATEERILTHIKEERNGKTTIVVASRISTVSHMDKVIVLHHGKLEAFGTPEELLTTSKTYAKMHMLQELEKEQKGANL